MERGINTKSKLTVLVLTALMMAVVMVMTMLIRVPSPTTKGYINLGDGAIFMAVIMLGKKHGMAAAGIGSAMADALSGYMYFAPWTLVIKGLMALVTGIVLERTAEKRGSSARWMQIAGMIAGGAVMVTGYYFAEVIMYGNWALPLVEIPLNATQFSVGIIIAAILSNALAKTPVGQQFAYPILPRERNA